MVQVLVLGSSLTMRSAVHRLPQTLCLLSTAMWYACIAGSGSGTIVVSRVLVLIFAHDDPYELPTHKRSAFLSVPMRRGPRDHRRGTFKPRSPTGLSEARTSPNQRSNLAACDFVGP